MPFLAALTILGWAHIIAFLRGLKESRQPRFEHQFALLLFMGAVFDFFYLSPANPKGVPGDARNLIPYCVFAFGVLSALVFGYKFYQICRTGRDTTVGGWRSGLSLSFALVGLYLAATAVDHWVFFSGEKSGAASAMALGVKNIQCDQMVLVRIEADSAEYRCPTMLAFGAMTSNPFVPWPSYSSGESKELKKAIESTTVQAQSIRQE